eukprot:4108662-Prymnesium_polylepis.1
MLDRSSVGTGIGGVCVWQCRCDRCAPDPFYAPLCVPVWMCVRVVGVEAVAALETRMAGTSGS